MNKIYKMIVGMLALTFSMYSQTSVQIGFGTLSSGGVNYQPIYRSSASSAFDYSRAFYLYDAAELTAAGIPAGATITQVEWDKSNNGATVSNTAAIVFNIYMKNSSATSYNAAQTWSMLNTGATTVYQSTSQVIPATVGWLPFPLTTPFVYTGQALEIMTDWDISAISGNPTTAAFNFSYAALSNHVLGTSNSTILTGTTSLATQSNRPNIKLTYTYSALPNDVGIQTMVAPLTTGCYSASENVVVTINNFGTNTQTNIPVSVIVSGAVSQTLNATYMGSLAGGASANFTVGTLNMSAVGTYSFDAMTSLAGDGSSINDAMPQTTRTVVAPVAIPMAVDFTGFTGANLTTIFPDWYEAAGVSVPTPSGTVWTSQTGLNGVGNITARINLLAASRNEWIVGPKFTATSNTQLDFDAAVTNGASTTVGDIMGSDDMVRVMVSTDCGASYTPIYTISATNSLNITFSNFSVPLGAYAGQDIIVGFLATDGPVDDLESYDFHLDNINIYNLSPSDAALTALVSPAAGGCYSATENLVVTINNNGTSAISNVPVTVVVSGAATQTSNATYSGTIAPGASVNFTVGVLNMIPVGTYSISATASLPGDANVTNDNIGPFTRIVNPIVAIPQTVDFTGFTGSNLTAMFANWSEGTGTATPTGTTSGWTSQTGLNGTGNITARINLLSAAKNDWILGPKFTAAANSQIAFDAAVTNGASTTVGDIMGSDDMVRVMVSTDCGLSYTPIYTISAANNLGISFTNFSVPLGAYAGQNIIVAFLAQDGPVDDVESYDFHLDNINLYNTPPTDAWLTALVSPAAGGCYGAAENLVVAIKNNGTANISNIPVTVEVAGAVTQTSNATYSGTITPGASTNFTVGVLNMTTAGTYSLKAFSALAGDGILANDTVGPLMRVTTFTVPLPQTVDFTGFTGSNLTTFFPFWYEAVGATLPGGTTSSWTSQTGLNGTGNITARINLLSAAQEDWIVGPKFTATSNSQIDFDAAVTNAASTTVGDIMGSDDMVRVMVSTDCGTSYAPIFTISATNSLSTTFTNFSIPLGAYAGQDIIIAFLATDGPVDDIESYDFHLDNINLFNAMPNDAGANALVSPAPLGCYSSSENVVVTLENNGTNSITNIPVTVTIMGAISQTINATYTGTIAPGATANFTVGTANMTTVGTYSFYVVTSLAGDPNNLNDNIGPINRVVMPVVAIPQTVSFTGFSGSNLPTFFPNWYEATGTAVPSGTTSSWTSQTGLNGTGNITARINLLSAAKNDWIVGPKFMATSASQIDFDAAVTNGGSTTVGDIMGSDDMVRVMVSNDCGASYTPIYTISATNSLAITFTNFTVSLGTYAGQEITVAFLATDGPTDDAESYDFHLDNINLFNVVPNDMSAIALAQPVQQICYGANEQVVIDVKNSGTASQSNIPVNVIISGASSQTLTGVIPGPLAGGATITYTMPTGANMSVGGNYFFQVQTALVGDMSPTNDSLGAAIQIEVASPLTTEDFNSIAANGKPLGWMVDVGSATYDFKVRTNHGVGSSMGMSADVYSSNPTSFFIIPKVPVNMAADYLYYKYRIVNFSSYANPGGTATPIAAGDSVIFEASTNCGTSFSPVSIITSANHSVTNTFAEKGLCLAAYSGQTISLRVRAVRAAGDWYVDIDSLVMTTIPSASLSVPASSLCPMSATISATALPAGGAYTGPGMTGNVFDPSIAGVGTYTVAYTYTLNGCTSTAQRTISVVPNPTVNVTSNDTMLCLGNTATLTATGASMYSWSTGTVAASIVVTPTTTTSYTVNGTLGSGCQDNFVFTQTVVVCTGIDNTTMSSSGINVYPNPTNGSFYVYVEELSSKPVFEMYDALGKLVLSKELRNQQTMISMNELANGIYAYRIKSNDSLLKQGKLIKE
jgi:hypothetical protein